MCLTQMGIMLMQLPNGRWSTIWAYSLSNPTVHVTCKVVVNVMHIMFAKAIRKWGQLPKSVWVLKVSFLEAYLFQLNSTHHSKFNLAAIKQATTSQTSVFERERERKPTGKQFEHVPPVGFLRLNHDCDRPRVGLHHPLSCLWHWICSIQRMAGRCQQELFFRDSQDDKKMRLKKIRGSEGANVDL